MNKTRFDKIYNDALDDLLKQGFIVENEKGFKITDKGVGEYLRVRSFRSKSST